MISLEAALERLLRSRALRAALREGRCEGLDVSDDDAAALRAIDPEELSASARAFVRSVRARSHRGCKNLERAFEATLALHRAEHPEDATLDDLFARFVESSAFDRASEGEDDPSLEERFFRFAVAAEIGDRETRVADYLTATMRALVTAPAAAANDGGPLPTDVRRCPGGWFSVDETGPAPRLFAAARGRTITGAVSRGVADILLGRRAPDPETRGALEALGLL